uniref:Uncharacterized protein n=1 Tax=Meloidogyne floridensis TaxID=298350 RepID=A0A915NRN1_9BILA
DIVAKALEVDSAAKLAEKDRKARVGEKRNSTKESQQQQQKNLYSIPTTSTTSILDNVGKFASLSSTNARQQQQQNIDFQVKTDNVIMQNFLSAAVAASQQQQQQQTIGINSNNNTNNNPPDTPTNFDERKSTPLNEHHFRTLGTSTLLTTKLENVGSPTLQQQQHLNFNFTPSSVSLAIQQQGVPTSMSVANNVFVDVSSSNNVSTNMFGENIDKNKQNNQNNNNVSTNISTNIYGDMSIFKNFFSSTSDDPQGESTNAEIVDRLVERLESASNLDDRRDALRALRSLARNLRMHVATRGMDAFMEVLEKNASLTDLVSLTLDILDCTLTEAGGDDDDPQQISADDEIGDRLAELMLQRANFMASLVKLLACNDFAVRRNTIKLLTSLLRHRPTSVQQAIISQRGVSNIVDLLNDKREVIRNNVVLMLSELSRGNSQIQQLLYFENAFQLLFEVIAQEPLESIVIEDCLFVMLNLLRKNASNQVGFREAKFVVFLIFW